MDKIHKGYFTIFLHPTQHIHTMYILILGTQDTAHMSKNIQDTQNADI